MREPSSQKPVDEAPIHQYHFGQVYQPFHLFDVTTLPTQVPRVGIGYRARPCSLFGSERSDIVGGLHTRSSATTSRMPPGPHIVLSMWPLWATLLHVKERTVPLVSIDHRGSPSLCSAQRGRYIISGLHTPEDAIFRRMPLPPRIGIQMGLFRQHVHPLKGALQAS